MLLGKGFADYNILTPQDMDDLLFSPYKQAIGNETWERLQRQIRYYQYYEGKQHTDPKTGMLVNATELSRPNGLDYDPTRYATNYFKAFVQRKSRWQFGGNHGITVKPLQIDKVADTVKETYTPSTAQVKENERAEGYEKLLYQLWKQNKMRENLLQASRDRLIAGNVGCKIMFNPRTGKIHWLFRPDTEIITVRSDDDFEDLIAVHFVQERTTDEGAINYWKQTFSLEEDGYCYLEEGLYDANLDLVKVITAKESMNITFLPYVEFPVQDLTGTNNSHAEAEALKEQNDILNALNEDAIDSLKFEMFSMTALIGVPTGTADKLRIAPASVLEIASDGINENSKVDIKKVEGGFRWKDAYSDTYKRVKNAMHEVSHLPNIVPQELNFGGLNNEALQIMFQEIIQETEEHWLVWQDRLQELHEKTVMYLQARTDRKVFGYDKDAVNAIGTEYESEINFVLPLPENRAQLVELLAIETATGFESKTGAMERLGVTNTAIKKQEIANERKTAMAELSPYGADSVIKPTQQGVSGTQPNGGTNTNPTKPKADNGA